MTPFLYINKASNNTNPLLYSLHRAGDNTHNSGFYFKRDHKYPYSSIHYISEGSLFYVYKSKRYLLKAGDMFLFDPYNNHEYGIANCSAVSTSFIEFNGGDSNPIMCSVLNNISPIIDACDNQQILINMKEIFSLINSHCDINFYLVSQKIYTILVQLLELNDIYSKQILLSPDLLKLKKALDYIDSNPGSTLSIEVLANISNYSPTYFASIFSKITGTTPAKYIMNKRISLAKDLLSSSDKKVEKLAFMLGFCNPSHFIRAFKRFEGLTPSQYRTQSHIYGSKL